MDVFIIKNEDFEDFIIGLDMIKKFKLIQNENLEIKQIKDINTKKTDNKSIRNPTNKQKEIETYSVNFNEHIKEDEFKIKIKYLDEKKRIEIEKIIEKYYIKRFL